MSSESKNHWKLSSITNLALLVLYLVGSILLVILVNINIKKQALENAKRYSNLILDRNIITHAYFNNALKTSLYELFDENFLGPDWMSSTFAINSISKDYGLFTEEDLYYKEAAINARNPANEADAFERAFIEQLNRDSSITSINEIRRYDGEPFFAVLRRGQQARAKCLLCHGDPADAPGGVLSHYGEVRGFGNHLDETLSVISVRIPLTVAYAGANQFTVKLSALLLVILLVIFIIHYTLSRQLLFLPISLLQQKAQGIANDPAQLGETLSPPIGLELVRLVEAFNQMSRNLKSYSQNQEEVIKERTAALAELQHRNELILNTTSEGILGLAADGTVTFINRSAQHLLGLTDMPEETLNIHNLLIEEALKPEHADATELINGVLTRSTHVSQQEAIFADHTGRRFPIEFSCAPIRDNGTIGAVLSFNDITQRKLSEQEIQNLAFYDQLTKLPNRTLFYDRITQRVAAAKRDRQQLALMFFDLDDFKMVNDTLGHAAGDDFLRVVAQRLKEGSRQADTVARMGGDEFVWFGEIVDQDDAELVARKFIETLARPVRLGQHNFSSTVSIGIALFPDSAEDIVGLMKCADSAMYTVKQKSKNAFAFYRKSMTS